MEVGHSSVLLSVGRMSLRAVICWYAKELREYSSTKGGNY